MMKTLFLRALLAACLLIPTTVAVEAQQLTAKVVTTCGGPPSNYSGAAGQFLPPTMDVTGVLCSSGSGGGGGSSGSVTAAGTNGTLAQAIQGINGGVPVPVTGSLSIGGTTSNATDGQATTTTNGAQVVYNYGFNGTTWDRIREVGGAMNTIVTSTTLPTGAATAANQNVTTAGTTATSAQAVQGVTGGVPQNVVAVTVSAPSTGLTATVTTTGTFQSFTAANTSRKGCSVQYRGTGTGYFFFGASAPGSTTAAGVFAVSANQFFYCGIGGANAVATDQIWVTGTAADLFSGAIQ